MHWQVDDVMTREVITVGVDTPVGQIVSLLDREDISAVPVTTATGGVLGVVSQADLLVGVADGERDNPRGGRPKGRATALRAGDLMTTPALSIDANASLTQAARTMQGRNVRRLLVTSPQGRLLGVVSRGDLLRPYARNDAEIRREVEAELRRRLWIHPEQVGARVHEGTATLTGAVGRHSTAEIATRVVATVPGVTKVVNRIRYDFDDADLVRSTVGRTHPFSAEPFHPGKQRRRGRIRLSRGSMRRQRQQA
ncbi:BON domain-containing protein [Jidongwangia harbinensis]|uniref:BON domain-containing protein n=1 Tax=Jidongwangia harbinensis TaxID=2878561 RepID=UPI001CD92A94|nr:CBS domain-containing protein [Jidongwangia harbinensis]MCA2218897.1 CBS domain-containing protein [Jidongwangia harbinensis]